MSTPRIPGFSTDDRPESLAELWERPSGEYPAELWPEDMLREIIVAPTEWIRIEEHYFEDYRHGGRGAVLVGAADAPQALSGESWIGRGLGATGSGTDRDGCPRFDDGLTVRDRGIEVKFLVRVRDQHGLRDRVVEVSHSFLWYWDAIEREDGWYYLNEAGQDQQLIRYEVSKDAWAVDVQALPLRRYLADSGQALIAQVDHVLKVSGDDFQRAELAFESDWARFSWSCVANGLPGDRPHFSRLLGQYAVRGSISAASLRWEFSNEEVDYPELVYDIDPESGSLLKHTCDPDQLGTYFDSDDSRLHYLTPINFLPGVMEKYTSDPERFHVDSTSITCLDLWSVDLSINTADLIEVYLGDIGRDIPARDWPHWLSYNVRPEGAMQKDRFRRDFLAQSASSEDPIGEMKALRRQVNEVAINVFGGPVWRELEESDRVEFERLSFVTTPQSLKIAILSLCKAFIESIDCASIQRFTSASAESESSLARMEDLFEALGGSRASVEPLRALQHVRSKGGIAHMAGRGRADALSRLGIDNMTPKDAFETIIVRVLSTLRELNAFLFQAKD